MSIDFQDLLLGKIILQQKLISPEKLQECLNIQKETKPRIMLGEIMVEKGFITTAQLEELLKIQQEMIYRKSQEYQKNLEEFLFGKILIRRKIILPEYVYDAIRKQFELLDMGIEKRLGDILVEEGLLTRQQVEEILKIQSKQTLYCEKCSLIFIVKWEGGKTYLCTKCKTRLTVPLKASGAETEIKSCPDGLEKRIQPRKKSLKPPPNSNIVQIYKIQERESDSKTALLLLLFIVVLIGAGIVLYVMKGYLHIKRFYKCGPELWNFTVAAPTKEIACNSIQEVYNKCIWKSKEVTVVSQKITQTDVPKIAKCTLTIGRKRNREDIEDIKNFPIKNGRIIQELLFRLWRYLTHQKRKDIEIESSDTFYLYYNGRSWNIEVKGENEQYDLHFIPKSTDIQWGWGKKAENIIKMSLFRTYAINKIMEGEIEPLLQNAHTKNDYIKIYEFVEKLSVILGENARCEQLKRLIKSRMKELLREEFKNELKKVNDELNQKKEISRSHIYSIKEKINEIATEVEEENLTVEFRGEIAILKNKVAILEKVVNELELITESLQNAKDVDSLGNLLFKITSIAKNNDDLLVEQNIREVKNKIVDKLNAFIENFINTVKPKIEDDFINNPDKYKNLKRELITFIDKINNVTKYLVLTDNYFNNIQKNIENLNHLIDDLIYNYREQVKKDMDTKLEIVKNNIKKIQEQENYIWEIYKILGDIQKESSYVAIFTDNISIINKSIEKKLDEIKKKLRKKEIWGKLIKNWQSINEKAVEYNKDIWKKLKSISSPKIFCKKYIEIDCGEFFSYLDKKKCEDKKFGLTQKCLNESYTTAETKYKKNWYKGIVNISLRVEEGRLVVDMMRIPDKEMQEMEKKFAMEECKTDSSDDYLLNADIVNVYDSRKYNFAPVSISLKSKVQLLDENDIEIIKSNKLEEANILFKFSGFSCKGIQSRKILSPLLNNFLLTYYLNNKPKCILYLDKTKAPFVICNEKIDRSKNEIDVKDIINKLHSILNNISLLKEETK